MQFGQRRAQGFGQVHVSRAHRHLNHAVGFVVQENLCSWLSFTASDRDADLFDWSRRRRRDVAARRSGWCCRTGSGLWLSLGRGDQALRWTRRMRIAMDRRLGRWAFRLRVLIEFGPPMDDGLIPEKVWPL